MSVTGDSGNGLTHGVLAGRLIADELVGSKNSWASLYSPSRLLSIAKSLPTMIEHDLQANSQYKRYLQASSWLPCTKTTKGKAHE